MISVLKECNVLHLFAYIEATLPPWDAANLVIMCDLLNMFPNFVCKYFVENFMSLLISEIVCN